MSSALEETRSVVQEAINVFNPAHDIEVIKSFKKAVEETNVARQQQQLALKASIRGLSSPSPLHLEFIHLQSPFSRGSTEELRKKIKKKRQFYNGYFFSFLFYYVMQS